MTLPITPKVLIRLGPGASFGAIFELGSTINGILGTNILGTAAAQFADVSATTQAISVTHGRDRVFEQYTTGQAVIQFLDFTGDWNPENTSSPYYGQIKPMRQVIITGEYSATEYPVFAGYITSWDWTWADQSVDYAIVTVTAEDGFRLLNLANIEIVTGAANKDLPGQRIEQILDEVDWPDTLRDIDLGDTDLQNDPGTLRTALEAIQTVENSDLGAFFIAPDGKATYYSRATLSTKAAGSPITFSDDGTNIAYQNLDVNLDETELSNVVTFTRHAGSPQTVFDSGSIDEYFTRTYERSDLVMETNAIALSRANQVLAYRKQVRLRVDSITLDLSSPSNRIVPGLTLDIGDPIIVNRDMAAGTSLSLRITVQGVSHTITPDRWTTTFTTAYPLTTAFILGSSEFGILGTNTL
jgi:hypothetical protein